VADVTLIGWRPIKSCHIDTGVSLDGVLEPALDFSPSCSTGPELVGRPNLARRSKTTRGCGGARRVRTAREMSSGGGSDKSGSAGGGGVAVKTPSDFLKSIRGRPVVVKLNSGVDYRGSPSLRSLSPHFWHMH
jgi:hypothetical protein